MTPRDLLAQLTETGDRYSIVRDGQRNVANVLVNGAIDPSPRRYEAFGSLRNGAAQIERLHVGTVRLEGGPDSLRGVRDLDHEGFVDEDRKGAVSRFRVWGSAID